MTQGLQASADPNQNVVLRFMSLMDNHQFDALDEVLAPGLQLQLGETFLDREQTEAMIRSVYEAFPDLTHHVEEIWGVDDRVVMRARDTATHTGAFQGIAASGKSVVMGQIAIYRIEAGRIAEIREQADLAGLMAQIGSSEEEVAGEIKARFRHWCDTEVELDMEAWAAVVTEDVVLQPPGMPAVRGKAPATQFCGDLLRSMGVVTMDPVDTTVLVSPDGDVAASFGGLRVVLDSGDEPQEFAMKSMVSWRRVDGEWLVAANSWSADEVT